MIFILSRVNHHIDHAEEFMAILPIFLWCIQPQI